nr:PLP-dependent aminotransferase family protein [Oceanibacterium hippocampi]
MSRPIYLSLVEQFGRAIAEGLLQEGERLPTHRQLAYELGISVQTVSRAYEELMRRGLASGEVGRGTFVRLGAEEHSPPYIPERVAEVIDLSMLKPVLEARHVDLFRAGAAAVAGSMPDRAITSFRSNVVYASHRPAALAWLRRCGIDPGERDVQITNGATAAIAVSVMTALPPGSTIATEVFTHHTLLPLARYLGIQVRGVAMDEEGIIPTELERLCREGDISALALLPNGAGPTAAFMSLGRREAIARIARHYNLWLIENDAWGPLIADRPPPFATLAPERTFYFTSFTKITVPALRIAYLLTPERLLASALNRHLVTNWMASSLIAELARQWVVDGTADELVRWQRQALARRQRDAAAVLGDICYTSHEQGLHLWLPLPEGRSESDFVSFARLRGVAVAPGSSFHAGAQPSPPGIRVSVGSTGADELRTGLGIIASLYRGAPEPALLTL